MIGPLRFVPLVLKQVARQRVRTLLTASGVAIAMFLFTVVMAMQRGVTAATRSSADDTRLVVYREARFCPATSRLPQDYAAKIAALPGVASVLPVNVRVSNCRTSLDVVVFRGVPKAEFLAARGDDLRLVAGSTADWLRRTDAALVGETLARRRGLEPGMTFDAAGITVTVAGIFAATPDGTGSGGLDAGADNAAYTALEFVQLAGRDELGIVTQFDVTVTSAERLEPVAAAIDALFETAREPTSTFTEQAFIGRVANDVIELVGFASWLGLGCLVAVLALVGNAVVLGVQGRVAEHAVLQTLGFSSRAVAGLIVAEGTVVAILGGAAGAAAAVGLMHRGAFALSVEGQSIPIAATPALLLLGLLVCGGLGVAAGLLPAWQAGRRTIAAGLRAV